jgi:hypothetical protein
MAAILSCPYIEKLRRRPISIRFVEYTYTGFAILLISFMLYVTSSMSADASLQGPAPARRPGGRVGRTAAAGTPAPTHGPAPEQ